MIISDINKVLTPLIENEFDEDVIVLDNDLTTKRTVSVNIFFELFKEADMTYTSLTQERYEPYRYRQFFEKWKNDGLIGD